MTINETIENTPEPDTMMPIAIILAAGVGSRIRPLTDDCPKCLLTIDGRTILERMIVNIQECGIDDIVVVVGYLEGRIREYIATAFPEQKVTFIVNERYTETNTGYSLLLAAEAAEGREVVKFDADVIFEKQILEKLVDSDHQNCLCIDTNIQLDAEEIKVAIDGDNQIIRASKTLDPLDAIGESIGIEKIGRETAGKLFGELGLMMEDDINHQEYYEAAYERLIEQSVPFFALDITGLNWIEIDTIADFAEAGAIFNTEEGPAPQPLASPSKPQRPANRPPAIG